jgi:hypothetical protein
MKASSLGLRAAPWAALLVAWAALAAWARPDAVEPTALPGCQPPPPSSAWASATAAGLLMSAHPERARLEFRLGSAAGARGYWIHLSETGPVHGAIAWWPCGAKRVRWIGTGGFVSWKTGKTIPGGRADALWLETSRFGTGLQVQQAHWLEPTAEGVDLVWQGDLFERFDGPDVVEVERRLERRAVGRWMLHELQVVNGHPDSPARVALCMSRRAAPSSTVPRLRPCAG